MWANTRFTTSHLHHVPICLKATPYGIIFWKSQYLTGTANHVFKMWLVKKNSSQQPKSIYLLIRYCTKKNILPKRFSAYHRKTTTKQECLLKKILPLLPRVPVVNCI